MLFLVHKQHSAENVPGLPIEQAKKSTERLKCRNYVDCTWVACSPLCDDFLAVAWIVAEESHGCHH